MIWFTADQHFAHENIITYTGRPFKNAQKMDQIIIARYRDRVKPEDTCYFLGDLTLKAPGYRSYLEHIVDQLPGRKIFILGNHDKFDPFTYVEVGFESVHTYIKVEEFNLIHDPAPATGRDTGLWLCGHIHTLFKRLPRVLNIGVDVWDFYPISIEEVRNEFTN